MLFILKKPSSLKVVMGKRLYQQDAQYVMIKICQMEEIIPYHLSMQISYRMVSQIQIPNTKRCPGRICRTNTQGCYANGKV